MSILIFTQSAFGQLTWRSRWSEPRPDNLMELMQELDPAGDEGIELTRRQRRSDGVLTSGGLFVHESCSPANLSSTERNNLEENILSSIDQVVKCANQYPEIEHYVGQWINRLRRIDLRCDTKPSNSGHAAYYDGQNMYFTSGWPSITGSLGGTNALMHELFHATAANNNCNHNDLNHRMPEQDVINDCQANYTTLLSDRVYTLTSLCEKNKGNPSELFYQQMKNCNSLEPCIRTFTYNGSASEDRPRRVRRGALRRRSSRLPQIGRMASESISRDQARVLCMRLFDEGHCQEARNKFDGESPFFQWPRNQKVLGSIAKRLGRFKSPDGLSFSEELFAIAPELNSQWQELNSNPCFAAMFERQGQFIRPRLNSPLLKNNLQSISDYSSLFSQIAETTYRNSSDFPEACTQEHKQSLRIFFTNARASFNHPDVKNNRLLGRVFQANNSRVPTEFGNLVGPGEISAHHIQDLSSVLTGREREISNFFIGEDVVTQFEEITSPQNHPFSDNFDCSANGLNPYEGVIEGLGNVIRGYPTDPPELLCRILAD